MNANTGTKDELEKQLLDYRGDSLFPFFDFNSWICEASTSCSGSLDANDSHVIGSTQSVVTGSRYN